MRLLMCSHSLVVKLVVKGPHSQGLTDIHEWLIMHGEAQYNNACKGMITGRKWVIWLQVEELIIRVNKARAAWQAAQHHWNIIDSDGTRPTLVFPPTDYKPASLGTTFHFTPVAAIGSQPSQWWGVVWAGVKRVYVYASIPVHVENIV